uniref:Uncharacterized protein n=1 Tax=Panagrolaimus davidi TaxID=227884 RepID=A0A914Q1W7_9BILA
MSAAPCGCSHNLSNGKFVVAREVAAEIDAVEDEFEFECGGAEYDCGIGGGEIAQEDSGGDVVDDRVVDDDIRCWVYADLLNPAYPTPTCPFPGGKRFRSTATFRSVRFHVVEIVRCFELND